MEERILSLYAVIASMEILKSRPRVDPVMHDKNRGKGGRKDEEIQVAVHRRNKKSRNKLKQSK